MTYTDLQYDVTGGIATITLDRPERLNAISGGMLASFSAAFRAAETDRGVRVIILTGAGRGFCAGLDLKEQGDAGNSNSINGSGAMPTTIDMPTAPPVVLHNVDKPVICALNGAAAGYGLDLALGCDIRIASETAKLAFVFTKRAVLPESGGSWLLPRLVGWSKAAELAFTGRTLSAAEGLAAGLVSKVVPAASLMDEARAIAEEIAANAPLAVQAMKRLFRAGMNEDFRTHSEHVLLQLGQLMATKDFQEGLASFMERRAPEFEGR